MNDIQRLLNDAIQKYELQQASKDCMELIIRKEMVIPFVNILDNIGIKIVNVTWWCHVDGTKPECPHGMGGPRNMFGSGWFSEMCHWDNIKFEKMESVEQNNMKYVDYYFNEFPKAKNYLSCIVPAFELEVPEYWKLNIICHRPWHSPPLIDNQVGPFDT